MFLCSTFVYLSTFLLFFTIWCLLSGMISFRVLISFSCFYYCLLCILILNLDLCVLSYKILVFIFKMTSCPITPDLKKFSYHKDHPFLGKNSFLCKNTFIFYQRFSLFDLPKCKKLQVCVLQARVVLPWMCGAYN